MYKVVITESEINALVGYFSSSAYRNNLSESINSFIYKLQHSEYEIFDNNLHQTEERYPEQCKLFRDTIEEMYTVMLKKNLDYSPYNIGVTGMRGLVTRLWDKSARFFSLMGLDIGTGEWNEPREPENESIDQNLIDWANYCIIARIFMEGKWAK